MTLADTLLQRARHLAPGSFALVMATGIVSIDVGQHDLPRVARALLRGYRGFRVDGRRLPLR